MTMDNEQEAGADRLDIDNMYLCGSNLARVNLSDSGITDAAMVRMVFHDVNMTGVTIDNANLTGAKLNNVNMTDVIIQNATLTNLAIKEADLTGMTINGVLVSDLFAKWEEG